LKGSDESVPVIGIPTSSRDENGRFSLAGTYVDAVRRAGGLPLLLPPGEPRLDVFINLIDGLLLPGGGDVDPKLYGGSQHETLYGVDPARDDAEIRLARHAVASGMPALCICRGAQVLNVALGGTLIEHLPDVVGESVLHRMGAAAPPASTTGPKLPKGHIVHPIEITSGTRLAGMLGGAPKTPSSSHHQAIKKVAPDLRVAARAADGTIEAVELPSHPWLFAVQWHPEVNAGQDPTEQKLFDELVAAARRRKA
jgi:putative glutamine amidotransferase